jgi:oligopeptidase B
MPKTTAGSARKPSAERRPQSRTIHGVTLVDDYAWLKADNWQEILRDPSRLPDDIRAVLAAENDYAETVLAPTKELRRRLVAEMRGRIKEDDADVPAPDGPFDYYERYREGGEHELICRRPRGGGGEELLLDGDLEAAGKSFFELGPARHSPDHCKLAWSADEKGSEFHSLRIRDLALGRDLADILAETTGEAVWSADSTAVYYVRYDANHRPNRVFRHRLGSAESDDRLVFEERDPGWFVRIEATQSRAFAIIAISDHDSSEAHLVDLGDPAASARLIAAREKGVRYDVEHHGARLILRTNAEGAEDFKIVEAPLADPRRVNWRDIVPYRPGRLIVRMVVFADYLARLEREDGLPRIVIRAHANGAEASVAFAEEAYSLRFEEMREFDTSILRFSYSSMTTPEEITDYDMATHARHLRKRQVIPSGHDPARYVTRRIFAPAADGETVPVSLLYAKATKIDGTAPLFLTGYGAYGYAIPASFNANRLSLVERGFVCAIAHVRGGTDKGWRWYTDGKLGKKPNTFTDFIAAARTLAQAGFTREGHIVAAGGSAGGMLMGAVANLAPDLFAAVIADVPFVDVLNTMLDADLPLTPPEWPEWGNPIEDEAAFATIRAYSPYDNIGRHAYPAILALGGLTDPRVTYWEPAKWVARLNASMTGGGPVLLKTDMEAGHGGAAGRFEHLEKIALEYAFAIATLEHRLAG